MKINIHNKEYDAVEVEVGEPYNLHLDGVLYQLTEQTKAWKPEKGNHIFFMDSFMEEIGTAIWQNTVYDRELYKDNNVFKTKALATKARDAIKELLLNAKKS